ncbi:putative oxidoreductase ephD [Favolaschia claudopus]|uniref:Oxidoreductase ephD n=1 Tax=Favolaschia claudopus TaxID=2862362 RepID=A0AAW0AHC4_9AGAR
MLSKTMLPLSIHPVRPTQGEDTSALICLLQLDITVVESDDPQIIITPTDLNSDISTVSTGRFVTSDDRTQIFAEARGDRDKPAVVFIHGFGFGGMAFNGIFDDLHWVSELYMVWPNGLFAWTSERLAQDFDAVIESYNLTRPFVLAWSTHIADIFSFHPANYLSGIIYTAAIPDTTDLLTIVSPRLLPLVLGLTNNFDVTNFQKLWISFINLCHPALEWSHYLACLGDIVVLPPLTVLRIITRTQSKTGLISAGKSGSLPVLAIFGEDDKAIQRNRMLDVLDGWKNLTVVDIPKAEHIGWVSQPVKVRMTVLRWISENSKRAI